MNITKEQLDDLNAILQIEIAPEDYQEKLDGKLRELRRKANMPGFRPGMVPMGMIKKMYGQSALVEIIDKMTSEGLFGYIKDNNLDILGSPLHNEEKNTQPEFTEGNRFNFFFDIAFNPAFDLNIEDIELNYYNIINEDSFIDEQIQKLRQRHGHTISPEIAEEDDRLFGEFAEMNENNEIKENGITHKSSVIPKMLKTKKELFTGLKKNDKVTFDIYEVFDNNETEITYVLGVSKDKLEGISKNFCFTVEDVFRIEPHELNEEFYKKIFPYSDIKSFEEFTEELKKEYEKQNSNQADVKLINDIHKTLIEKVNIALPDNFLKRWILHNDEEGKLTKEKLEEDYSRYADSMKWQLIENKLVKTYNITVGDEDVTEYVMSWFKKTGEDNEDEELRNRAKDFAAQIMKNKEEAKRMYDKIFDDKMMKLFKEKIKITTKEVNWEEFIKLA